MINFNTLFTYLFKLYLGYFIAVLVIISGALVLSNIFDVLQKFKTIHVPTNLVWKLVLYKIPYLLGEIASLISFISTLFFLRRLTKYNELVTILCSGHPIWKIFIIPVIAAFLIGVIFVTIVNPIGVYGLQKHEKLEKILTKKNQGNFIVAQSGLLFFEEYNKENRIIQAKSMNITTKELKDLTILFVDSNNNLLKRIDANSAILSEGNFKLISSIVITNDDSIIHDNLTIPTNLSIGNFTDRFIVPEMISIWKIKSSINKFLKFGLPIINYQIHYYKLLFKPLTMVSTVILASCFISIRQRDNSQVKMLVSGLFLGFIIYSLIEIFLRILVYKGIEPILAVLLPTFFLMFISNFIILHSHKT